MNTEAANSKNQHLLNAINLALNDWGMMMLKTCKRKDFSPPNDMIIKATIQYSGSIDGELSIVSTEKWGNHLARNLLGLNHDQKAPPGIGHSSIMELLNIVCGHFLTQHYGVKNDFEIGIPQVENLSENDFFDFENNREVVEIIADREKIYCLADTDF